MSHYQNRRSFASRTARGFARLPKFSSADKPAPEGLASAGTTGSAEGSDSKIASDTGRPDSIGPEGTAQRNVGLAGATHAASRQREETAGAFIPMLAVGQYHYDRWATLAVIVVFLGGYIVAAIRSNRSSRPTTPPRGPFAGHGNRKASD